MLPLNQDRSAERACRSQAAILKGLSKVPADRFRSAGEFVAALDRSAPRAVFGRGLKSRMRTAGLALAALAGLSIIALLARSFGDSSRAPPAVRHQLTFVGKALLAAISPDGKFLAYTVDADTAEHLLVQDLEGGRPDTIDTRFGHNNLEWAPDGSRPALWTPESGIHPAPLRRPCTKHHSPAA